MTRGYHTISLVDGYISTGKWMMIFILGFNVAVEPLIEEVKDELASIELG